LVKNDEAGIKKGGILFKELKIISKRVKLRL
jgi:hypothetical protein